VKKLRPIKVEPITQTGRKLEGLFHGWAENGTTVGEISNHYTGAIVELDNGKVEFVPIEFNRFQFLDRGE